MRIGIDFHAAEEQGSGNCSYIRSLVESLLAIDKDNDYFLYITDPSLPYYQTLSGRRRVRLRPLAGRNAALRIPSLGLLTRADKVDLLHVQYVAPPIHGGGLVVSVHDLSFIRTPRFFPWGTRTYLKTLVPLSLKKARQIISISEFSVRDIESWYPGSIGKIHLTHLAAASRFKPDRDRTRRQALFQWLGFRDPYLLYLGRLDPRKNIPALIQTFAALKKKDRLPHKLVIAGGSATAPPELTEELRRADLGGQAFITGFVPDALMPALYSQAEVFVYPSLYEGFGLPVLEAMACGCPVVCADSAALPEIVGKAGLLVDLRRPGALGETLSKVLSRKSLRERMRRAGLRQSKKFSWKETARLTLSVYQAAAQSSAESP